MKDPMDDLLHRTLSARARPELPMRFAQHLTTRIITGRPVRFSVRLLLTAYWVALGFFALTEVAQIAWPAWLVAAAILSIPLIMALITLCP